MTDAEKKLAEIAKIVENGTIEDVKAVLEDKPKKWMPEIGDVHYLIDPVGNITKEIWQGVKYPLSIIKHNNCFRTEEEAIRVRDYRQRHGHKDSILSLMEEAARRDRETNPEKRHGFLLFWSKQNKQFNVLNVPINNGYDQVEHLLFTTIKAAERFSDEYKDELEVLKPEGV